MVEEETRRYRPTKNYLEHLPPLNLAAFEVRCMLNIILKTIFVLTPLHHYYSSSSEASELHLQCHLHYFTLGLYRMTQKSGGTGLLIA